MLGLNLNESWTFQWVENMALHNHKPQRTCNCGLHIWPNLFVVLWLIKRNLDCVPSHNMWLDSLPEMAIYHQNKLTKTTYPVLCLSQYTHGLNIRLVTSMYGTWKLGDVQIKNMIKECCCIGSAGPGCVMVWHAIVCCIILYSLNMYLYIIQQWAKRTNDYDIYWNMNPENKLLFSAPGPQSLFQQL